MVSVYASDGVVTITLDRAERHNSLVPQLLEELRDAFRNCEASARGTVILRASGPSFSTGGDLRGFVDHVSNIREYSDRLVGLLNETVVAIFDCPLPVIAAVDGQVTGGSLGLVLAADIVLVTERATFRPYYTEVGLSPDGGWAVLLPDIIGRKRASAVQLLNQKITADQALDWGLATAYANSEDLDDAPGQAHGKHSSDAPVAASRRTGKKARRRETAFPGTDRNAGSDCRHPQIPRHGR
jgi:2-(1,2-epoxy-1,2-dihydrophenyl)acetyl-CoA isomerase